MSPLVRRAAALAALLVVSACAERSPVEPRNDPGTAPPLAAAPPAASEEQARNERLARHLAVALGNAGFRAEVFAALTQSPVREGKVHFQRLLSGRLERLAALAQERQATIAADLGHAPPLELYLPVPEHRRAWSGDAHILVATALRDRDAPVAFDPSGQRLVLDAKQPPATPVLALGRAETTFEPAGPQGLLDDGGGSSGGTGTSGGSPGLYMTYARITSSFEGWLKGAPEFEIHVLGQDGSSNAMKSYQCAGESAGAPYQYNHDNTEWRGSVMLFSQAQLDSYKAQHSGQAVRLMVIEDDDTRCAIKTDSARVAKFFTLIATHYGTLTAGRDTLISVRTFRRAQTLINIFKAFWSAIQSQDDLVGTAIEDAVAGEYFPGANWIIKGENTVTQGALKLEMR